MKIKYNHEIISGIVFALISSFFMVFYPYAGQDDGENRYYRTDAS